MPQVVQDLGQRQALRELQSHAPVARKVAGRRENQVAGARQAENRLGGGAHRHAEARDLGQAAGDERGARVVTEPEAVADAGGDRHHVLHRAADLHPDKVGAEIHAHAAAVQQCGGFAREAGIAGGERQRARQPARHLFGKRRARTARRNARRRPAPARRSGAEASPVPGSKPLHSQTSGARLLPLERLRRPATGVAARQEICACREVRAHLHWGGISMFGQVPLVAARARHRVGLCRIACP